MKSRSLFGTGALLLVFGCGGGSSHSGSPVGKTYQATPVYRNLETPSALRFAPDGRLFYTELQTGRIRVISANGNLLDPPFATVPVQTDGEQGLLGLALDPDFSTNRFVYVCYTDSDHHDDRIVRFTDNGSTGSNETVIVQGLPIAGNHNGGRIAFGADGKLYMTIGENGDPANSQNPSVLPGKILRFNSDGTIPADNPVDGNPMWALGIRNSFGIAFQPGTGALYESENGPSCDDEINRIVKGGNFGWRPDQPCNDHDAGFIQPLIRFNPTIAPTGVAFVTSPNLALDQTLLMTSYNDGTLRAFDVSGGSIQNSRVLVSSVDGGLYDVAQGPDGTVYFSGNSAIYRLDVARD